MNFYIQQYNFPNILRSDLPMSFRISQYNFPSILRGLHLILDSFHCKYRTMKNYNWTGLRQMQVSVHG